MLFSLVTVAVLAALTPAEEVADALVREHRISLRAAPEVAPDVACLRDALCLTRLADAAGARLVLFGSQPKDPETLLIGGYDIRRGTLLTRPVPKQNPAAIRAGVELLVTDLLGGSDETLAAVFVGVQTKQEVSETLDVTVPWVLYGSGLVAGGGAVAAAGAATLAGVSAFRFGQAAGAPDGAGEGLEREAATYGLAALMTTLFAGGLFMFAAMGTTYYAFDELGWADVRPIE